MMRPGEFWEALNAYNIEVTAERKHIGELARGATLRLWNLQVARKDRIADVRKFWPMPWDNPEDDSEIKRLANLSEDEARVEAERFFAKVKNGVQ